MMRAVMSSTRHHLVPVGTIHIYHSIEEGVEERKGVCVCDDLLTDALLDSSVRPPLFLERCPRGFCPQKVIVDET